MKSLDVDKGSYKKILKVLEKIFQPEVNDMMSHCRFCTIKQKQGQSLLTNLHLVLPKCRWADGQEKLKDQFLFRIMVCNINKASLRP